MSGIVGGINLRSSGLVNISSASDGQVFTGTGAGLPVGSEAAAGGGKVLQVVQTIKSDTQTIASSSFVDITDLTVAITPAATSSKILIHGTVTACISNDNNDMVIVFVRDSTAIGIGDAAGSRLRATATAALSGSGDHPETITSFYLDSPSSTSEIDYKIQYAGESGNSTLINGNRVTTDNADPKWARYMSNIVAIEIGA